MAAVLTLTFLGAAIAMAVILVKITKLLFKTLAILAVILLAFAIGVSAARLFGAKTTAGEGIIPMEQSESVAPDEDTESGTIRQTD